VQPPSKSQNSRIEYHRQIISVGIVTTPGICAARSSLGLLWRERHDRLVDAPGLLVRENIGEFLPEKDVIQLRGRPLGAERHKDRASHAAVRALLGRGLCAWCGALGLGCLNGRALLHRRRGRRGQWRRDGMGELRWRSGLGHEPGVVRERVGREGVKGREHWLRHGCAMKRVYREGGARLRAAEDGLRGMVQPRTTGESLYIPAKQSGR